MDIACGVRSVLLTLVTGLVSFRMPLNLADSTCNWYLFNPLCGLYAASMRIEF